MPDLKTVAQANIGPGPNSTAYIMADKPELINEAEAAYLKAELRDEDGDHLYHICGFLGITRDMTIHLAGAHHEIEELADVGEQSYTVCIFCGEDYHWRVRCPRNRDGAV
jgi:hypothetical protein